MKLDLSKLKLKSKDDKFAYLHHDDGHEIKIAINALHPHNRAGLDELPKFADGSDDVQPSSKIKFQPSGFPQPDPTPAYTPQPDSPAVKQQMELARKMSAQYEAAPKGDVEESIPTIVHTSNPQAQPSDASPGEQLEGSVRQSFHTAPRQPMASGGFVSAMKAKGHGKSATKPSDTPRPMMADGGYMPMYADGTPNLPPVPAGAMPDQSNVIPSAPPQPGQQPYGTPDPAAPPQAALTPVPSDSNPQPAPVEMAQSASSSDDDQAKPSDSSPLSPAESQVPGAENIAGGIKGESAAQADQAKADAESLKRQGAAQLQLASDFQEHSKNIQNEISSYIQDIKDTHIDPKRFMGKLDTGGKITAAIGLALGGLGAGVTGGPNQALEFINKQIDRDIDAQKTSLGKKESLLNAAYRQYGNLRDATDMTKMLMSSQAANEIAQHAARAGSPLAQSRAQGLIGQLQQQIAPMTLQMAMRKTLNEPSQSGTNAQGQIKMDPALAVRYMVPADKQKEVAAQIDAAQDTKRMSGAILNSFDQAAKENTILKTGAGMVRTPASVYALHQAMQPTFKDLEGTVRQAAMDNTFKNITPQPGDSQHTLDTKRQALIGYLQSKASASMAKTYGIDLNKFESTAPVHGAPQIITVGGVKYAKDANGKAVKVQ